MLFRGLDFVFSLVSSSPAQILPSSSDRLIVLLPSLFSPAHALAVYIFIYIKQESDRRLNLYFQSIRNVVSELKSNCRKVAQSAALHFRNPLGTWANFRTTDSRLRFIMKASGQSDASTASHERALGRKATPIISERGNDYLVRNRAKASDS